MTTAQLTALVSLAVVALAVILWRLYRSSTFNRARRFARRVFPVWAAQGPFDSAVESAAAMRYAYQAVFGSEEAERIGVAEAVAGHAAAYDRDPAAWENTRQEAMLAADAETQKFLRIAKSLATRDSATNAADTMRASTEALPWSDNPGAHEAHLIRRQNNPYFPKLRREVSYEDLVEAQRKDREDYSSCQQRLEQIEGEIKALAPNSTSGDLLELRERLDDLILFSLGAGGRATEIASKANRLRDAVIADLRDAFSNDANTLRNIEAADDYHRDNTRRFYVPVIAQMLMSESPILKEETIPTILSEDPSAIAIFMNSLPSDSRALIEVGALKMMKEVLADGYVDPRCEEKIFALRGEWPIHRP